MKTTFVIELVVLSLFGSSTLMGQGLSSFELSNAPHTGVDAPIFDAEGTPLGPDYSVELWGGVMADSLVPAYGLVELSRYAARFAYAVGECERW